VLLGLLLLLGGVHGLHFLRFFLILFVLFLFILDMHFLHGSGRFLVGFGLSLEPGNVLFLGLFCCVLVCFGCRICRYGRFRLADTDFETSYAYQLDHLLEQVRQGERALLVLFEPGWQRVQGL
jgi:hypothetical protein